MCTEESFNACYVSFLAVCIIIGFIMVKSNFGIFDKEKVFDDENSTLKLLLYHESKMLDKVEDIMFQ